MKRTRLLVAGAALLLVVAVGGYFVAGYFRQQRLRKDIPLRLGLDVQQDSNGFTVSKSENGHTIFTLHAARAVQFKAGNRAQLHEVKITLFGPPGSTQQDVISGSDFVYDQNAQTASADGEVLIDLQGVTYKEAEKALGEKPRPGDAERGTIHLKTKGLTFSQKTGIAETANGVEFRLPKAEGTAHGARYDSAQGTLELNSDVVLHTLAQGTADTIVAGHALLTRSDRTVAMENATLHSGDKTATAQRATAYLTQDGALQQIVVQQALRLSTADGAEASAPRGDADFGADGHAQKAHLAGGVQFSQAAGQGAKGTPYSVKATAQQAWLYFTNTAGQLSRLHLQGAAHIEQQRTSPAVVRLLDAGDVDASFAAGKISVADAHGSPVVTEREQLASGTAGRELRGDSLVAHFTPEGETKTLHADGNTRLAQQNADGSKQTSSGDVLDANFSGVKTKPGEAGSLELAVQKGHVRLRREFVQQGKAQVQNGSAAEVTYRAADDTVVLTGSPRLGDGTLELASTEMTILRQANVLHADGAVKGTYASQNGGDATHVISAKAVVDSAHHAAQFEGNARLWQGGNTLEAPRIDTSQEPKRLVATAARTDLVRASFLEQPRKGQNAKPRPAFVTAQKLVYTDADRVAKFSGDAVMRDADGTVRADTLDIFLTQAGAGSGAGQSFSGKLDRAVASGQVRVQQPERSGTGDRLVYTAADATFVLTGNSLRPPRLDDRQKGTVSGETITFRSHDERAEVGGQGGASVDTHVSR